MIAPMMIAPVMTAPVMIAPTDQSALIIHSLVGNISPRAGSL
jgi:hypothetical protein